jgi:hypothetical protein
MPRRTGLNLSLVGLLALLSPAAPARAGLNLPQIRQLVTLPANLVGEIRANLEPSLAAPVSAKLLTALPQDFRGACADMLENWGDIARGTDEWRVRVLLRQADQVWLSFRCASRAREYGKDYDERPALLNLGTGRLAVFPLGSGEDSTFHHVEYAGSLALDGAEGVALKVTEPAENPCCDGPESRSGKSWQLFAPSAQGVTELLSVVTARDDSSHSDDPDVDSATTYRGQIALDRDARHRVREVAVTFREAVEDITYEGGKPNRHVVSRRSGARRFRWNPGRLKFDEVR